MAEQSNTDNRLPESDAEKGAAGEEYTGKQLSLGYAYLSNALKVSFVALKVIMGILVILFLGSGLRTVANNEKALVLMFGKIRGISEDRVLGPGLKPLLPYPINEIIRIPVETKVNLPVDSFWYYQNPRSPDYVPRELTPEIDGYCIIRGEKKAIAGFESGGSDYNIVHSRWELTYQITDPERFYKNIYVDITKLQAGQNYADVIEPSVTPLLRNIFADAVVTAMVNYTVEEAMFEKVASVTQHVRTLAQQKLDDIESGIKIVSVQLNDMTWPRQVNAAFQASITASQESRKQVSEAKLYAEKALNEAAGPIAEQLLAVLDEPEASEEEKELLWSQLAGEGQDKIARARAYRTRVFENAKADADYLQQLLPEYRKRPRLVLQKIYQDAIEYVLDNVEEKVVIQPTAGAKGREIRIMLNRDPGIKPQSGQEE